MATRFEIISQTVVRSIALENHFDALREGFHKPIVACPRLVTAHNCVCSLIRICCNTTRCGPLRERGTTTLVLHLRTSCVSPVASSPTCNALDFEFQISTSPEMHVATCPPIHTTCESSTSTFTTPEYPIAVPCEARYGALNRPELINH